MFDKHPGYELHVWGNFDQQKKIVFFSDENLWIFANFWFVDIPIFQRFAHGRRSQSNSKWDHRSTMRKVLDASMSLWSRNVSSIDWFERWIGDSWRKRVVDVITYSSKWKALRVIPRGKQRLTVYRAHQVYFTDKHQYNFNVFVANENSPQELYFLLYV